MCAIKKIYEYSTCICTQTCIRCARSFVLYTNTLTQYYTYNVVIEFGAIRMCKSHAPGTTRNISLFNLYLIKLTNIIYFLHLLMCTKLNRNKIKIVFFSVRETNKSKTVGL